MEPGMASEPSLYFRMFVRGIVVDDQMEIFFRRCDLIDDAQEFQPFLMAVPVIAHADYRAIESIHGSEQSGCPVPLVVVGHSPTTASFDRQTGLRAVQRLDLTLLIGA